MRRAAVAAALAVFLGACGSSTSTAPPAAGSSVAALAATPAVTATPVPAATPAPTAAPPAAATSSPSVAPTPAPKRSVAPAGLDGPWDGAWQDTTPDTSSGTFTVTFAQSGTHLSGTIAVHGTPCIAAGTVTGTVTGGTIKFGAVSGRVTITYEGSVSGGSMHGTYAAPDCGDATGSWSATKKG